MNENYTQAPEESEELKDPQNILSSLEKAKQEMQETIASTAFTDEEKLLL